MKLILPVIVVSLVLGFAKTFLTQNNYILPDLAVSSPEQLFIDPSGGVKNLRFSTTFINKGKAPLELLSESDPETERTKATQLVKKTDGSVDEHFVGEFVFHPTHSHWHIEDYAQFQIWTYNEKGEQDELMAETEKMSFCIWDEYEFDLTLEGAPAEAQYNGCNNVTQGISIGWSDTYEADVDGQVLDITNIPDGDYLVRTTINMDHKIMESDYSNNEDVMYVEIFGNTIIPIELQFQDI